MLTTEPGGKTTGRLDKLRGQMGVTAIAFMPGCIIGPLADAV